jgi:hypothetical protein
MKEIIVLLFSAFLIVSYTKVAILKMGWTGYRLKKIHIRNFENMGFSYMLYVNIACTTDQFILPEENAPLMK